MSAPCTSCQTPTNTYLCSDCGRVLRDKLETAEWLRTELEVTRVRLAKTAHDRVGGRSATKPLPWNEAAADAAHLLVDTIRAWAPDVARVADEPKKPLLFRNTCRWMARNVNAFGRLHDAGTALAEITHAVTIGLEVIDHPVDRLFAGRCTLDKNDEDGCDADLYETPGVSTVTCWKCRAMHDMSERRDQMLASRLYWSDTPAHLASLFMMTGHPVLAVTIRAWASKGLLFPVGEHADCPRRYVVRDVLALKYGEDLLDHLASLEAA